MLNAVILDVGGTMLGSTDLFENIVAVNTGLIAQLTRYSDSPRGKMEAENPLS